MSLKVINAFVDKRTGETIEAGKPVPEGLDDETIARLKRARCLVDAPLSPPNAKREGSSSEEREVSDAAQKLADEAGVDLGQVVGTGANGNVKKSDVEDYLKANDGEDE